MDMLNGLLLVFLAGAMNGSFPLPMRYMRKWAWENIWTVWSIVALVVVPWLLAFLTVPHLPAVYSTCGLSAILLPALFGFFWGVSAFTFGLSVQLVGMSLTFAVVNGLSSAIGSWVPLVVQHPGKLFSPGGLIVSSGVIGVVGGVALCSWAGHLRSKQATNESSAAGNKSAFWLGLAMAITAGLFGPFLNLGFAFGQKIRAAALLEGSSPALANNAVLAIVLTAGFFTNIGYCSYRLVKNRTGGLFAIAETKKYLMLSTIMGASWILAFAIYGSSTALLGQYGTVVGWPMMMAFTTIVGSLLDIAGGNWSKRPLWLMAAGVVWLIGAVAVISYGLFRLQQAP